MESSYFHAGGRDFLYFSSTREGRQRVYYSVNFGPAQLAPGGVNSSAADARPNVRQDGLEIVWDFTRFGMLGGPDIGAPPARQLTLRGARRCISRTG